MLRVISQDGLTSILYDKVYAYVVFGNEKYEIRFMHISDGTGTWVTGAVYSTEDKANKVLAEMYDWWKRSRSGLIIWGLPEDEEVSE